MKALPRSYFWWLRLDQKTEVPAAHCDACKSIAVIPTQAPRHPWQSPNAPRDRVYMGFSEYNSKHFLLVIDAYSKWPEVCYMSSTYVPPLVEILEESFVFHGFPRLLVSDKMASICFL